MTTPINHSTAIFLLSNSARAVLVAYEASEGAPRIMFKTLDKTVGVDDFVVIPTDIRHKMTVAKVVDVDVDVDFDDPTEVKWIIARIDRGPHEEVLGQEAEAIREIKNAEALRKRDALRETLFASHTEKLKTLAISDMNGDAPVDTSKE